MTRKIKIHWSLKCALTCVYAYIIYAVSSQDTSSIPLPIHLDKLIHFAEYGILCTFVCWVVSSFPITSAKIFYLITIGITSLYGISDEFHQSFTPHRSVEIHDWLADTTGAAAASFFWRIFLQKHL